MIAILLAILVTGVITGLVQNLVFLFHRDKKVIPGRGRISILMATRNEEQNIRSCLDSLLAQTHLAETPEILVGDDASTDGTMTELSSPRYASRIQTVSVEKRLGNAQGKGNVIAHLTKVATTDLYCITDADMRHAPEWAATVSSGLNSSSGISIGVTAVGGQQLSARLQNIDWLLAQGKIKVATSLKVPVTALGNNMAISRTAYESTGGLENLPKTLTEDFQMFRYIQRAGHRLVVNFTSQALCFTQPARSMSQWLNQRKRWAFGALRIHWLPLVLLVIHFLMFPVAVALAFFMPTMAVILLLSHFLLEAGLLGQISQSLKLKINWVDYTLYQFVSYLAGPFIALYCVMPGSVEWKGRRYPFWQS